MTPQLIVLYHGEPSPVDVHFGRLSELLGVGGAFVEARRLPEIERSADHSLCIVASADTIASLSAQPNTIQQLYRKGRFLFVHGFRNQESHNRVARLLTDEQISGVVSFGPRNLEYGVSSSEPEITREFCGLSFGPVHSEIDSAFAAPTAGIQPLICIDKMPFWMMLQKEQCTLFLLACSEIADVNQHIEGKLSAGEYFSRLMPSAMFIRFVYKEAAWHVPQRFANLIIDDPLLTDSYGFLNYRRFVELMEQRDCCATIAFIPWNYKRTQQAVADLFRRYPDRLSLCVHGCDHTQAEFSEADLGKLNDKIQLASQRMKMHEAWTGVPCSEVMVFPQGCFSRESLRALKANNYLAAVNSGASPADTQTGHANRSSQEQLTIAGHLTPAITKYGYPLFLRRYPGKIEDLAFDLFFGKPALVVEHHSCFKDDGTGLMDLVGKLNGLNCKLIWAGLGETFENIYLEKRETDDRVECQILTNYQTIRNDSFEDKRFAVTKYENGNVPVDHVLVNGEKVRFTVEGNRLRLAVEIPGKQSAKIRIVYRNVLPERRRGEPFGSKSMVWGRRLLSELRDNVLSKNDLLLGAAYAAKRAIVKGLQRG